MSKSRQTLRARDFAYGRQRSSNCANHTLRVLPTEPTAVTKLVGKYTGNEVIKQTSPTSIHYNKQEVMKQPSNDYITTYCYVVNRQTIPTTLHLNI